MKLSVVLFHIVYLQVTDLQSNMSDDNVDKMTVSLLRSQTARELESRLLQLRIRGQLQPKEKPAREKTRQVSRWELELPDIYSSSAQMKSRRGLIKSAPNQSSLMIHGQEKPRCLFQSAKNMERQKSGPTSSEINLALCGNSLNTETFVVESSKFRSVETGKDRRQYDNGSVNQLTKGILPVRSGPFFRPWPQGKKEENKGNSVRDNSSYVANAYRFYDKQQRPKSDCFNLGKVLSEVCEVGRISEYHALGAEVFSLTPSCVILCPRQIQGKEFENRDCSELGGSEKVRTVPVKVTVKKEQRLKKLLRRKLISCYDLGPVMTPFDALKGETLNPKNSHSELKFTATDFPPGKQEIFPFAVPHFRPPLLPSSRNELVKVTQLLTSCRLFPWQLQNTIEAENQRKEKLTKAESVITREEEVGDVKEVKRTSQERDRAALEVFVPAPERGLK